jgi:hypothetical protein
MAFVDQSERFNKKIAKDSKELTGHQELNSKPNIFSFNQRSKKVSQFDRRPSK